MLLDGALHPNEQQRLQNQYNFSVEYGTGVHATCGYQYPQKSDVSTKIKPIVLVLFLFPTLGISKRMHNFSTHIWMAHVVQHATAVPIYLENEYVTFGHHDSVSAEAWGGSKKYN